MTTCFSNAHKPRIDGGAFSQVNGEQTNTTRNHTRTITGSYNTQVIESGSNNWQGIQAGSESSQRLTGDLNRQNITEPGCIRKDLNPVGTPFEERVEPNKSDHKHENVKGVCRCRTAKRWKSWRRWFSNWKMEESRDTQEAGTWRFRKNFGSCNEGHYTL
ncbi:hypothetical protein PM082_002051 [Marasmius tenuissimus]|nr:hypothetical protein PM082_002051 [Marasmius tenuissimus]